MNLETKTAISKTIVTNLARRENIQIGDVTIDNDVLSFTTFADDYDQACDQAYGMSRETLSVLSLLDIDATVSNEYGNAADDSFITQISIQ